MQPWSEVPRRLAEEPYMISCFVCLVALWNNPDNSLIIQNSRSPIDTCIYDYVPKTIQWAILK